SAGPAYDGRIKPEISAYGGGGTSDAAALVSGAALILQDAFKDENLVIPSGDLVKAMLIAGSEDILNPGPDFISGYGQLNLRRSTEIVSNNWWAQGLIPDVETSQVFSMMVLDGISKIQIALVWNDPPANNGDNLALINDLDLKVNKDANQWNPWVLDSSPNATALSANATTGQDHLNNVEFITIQNPDAGEFTLTVSATELSSAQSFSIAYFMEIADNFQWLYPTRLDPQESGVAINLYFENSYSETGTISYDDLSGNWIEIGSVEQGQRQIIFNAPSGKNEVVLRAVFGENEIKSDTFSVHTKSDVIVELLCDSELGLSWDPVEGAEGYEILAYLDGELSALPVQADTFAMLDRELHPSLYYTVRPKFEFSDGRPDETVRVDRQAVGCYLNNFLVSTNTDGSITL
ncbi:MAG: hypothetical protein RIF46_07880, partial [Cyclobacteriaceae bacterium]